MAITKTQQPYEFVIRWKNGKISGAHIKFLDRIIDDDGVTVLSEKEGEAQSVSMAGEVGYPIADILTLVQSTALADLATVTAQLDALKAGVESFSVSDRAVADVKQVA